MQIKPKFKLLFREQLILDAYFLFSQGIMDYSMLVIVGNVRGVTSLTIIDFFQKYNCRKKVEYFLKKMTINCVQIRRNIINEMICSIYYTKYT